MYTSFVYDHRSLKEKQWYVSCVVGDNKLPYSNDTASPVAFLLKTKLVINSTIFNAKFGMRFLNVNLEDYFLVLPM